MENIITSWDPLEKGDNADLEIISASKKREIGNILKSYVGMYDSFSELIQNGMDAVDRREKEVEEVGYTKHLYLTIDLSENSFLIVDNGIGFNEKEFESFIAPNISFKNRGESRGNKGVGATYIAYGFDYLQFATKGNGYTYTGEMKKGRSWVDDTSGTVTRPIIEQSKLINEDFNNITRGSCFKIKFGGKNSRPKDLNWYSATTPEQWLYLLLIKTPLGTINYFDSQSNNITFDITVIDKNNESETISNQEAKYIFPHDKIAGSIDLKDVLAIQEKLVKENKDASNLPLKFFKKNGLYEKFKTSEILSLIKDKQDENYHTLIEEYKIEAYGYFTYSTSVWDALNDKKANLRKSYRVLKGGIQLANNRMIQGDLITIPLTSNIGYQNQCHIVIHFKEADPDLGRKGFQPELKKVAEKISVVIVNRFKKWKKLLKSDTGSIPNLAKETELHEWIKEQEDHESKNPLVLSNKNFFAPIKEISITSEPQSEQDVIVLFNQLIAGGVIRGINLLATSQVKQYDGIYKFIVKEPLINHEFHKENNPLGVVENHFKKEFIARPQILEYKFNLDGLIREFETEYKKEKDIHLAIAWDIGEEWRKNYDVISLLDLDNIDSRPFHGITHIFNSGTTEFYVIILKELIDYLNDIDSSQKFQQNTYGNDLF